MFHNPASIKTLINLAATGNNGALEQLLTALVFGENYATYAGSPMGNVTPVAKGQWVFDTTNSVWYRSTGLANTDWTRIGGSGGLVAAGATKTLTHAEHDGKTILLDTLAGSIVTLPAATGSGAKYRFVVSVKATSNSHVIQVASASDIIQGIILAISDGSNAELGWIAGATADTITLNRTTTGSVSVGEYIELEDIATGVFAVRGSIAETGTEATPFSAAV